MPSQDVEFAPLFDLTYDDDDASLQDTVDCLVQESVANDSLSPLMATNLEKKQTLRAVLQVVSILCLLFYAYVVFVIARHLRVTLNNPFYAYVISLAISDFLILVHVATRLSEREVLRKAPQFWTIPFLVQLCWYSNLFNVLGLTCTRFVAVVFHRNAKRLLRWRNIIVSLVLVWLFSLIWAMPILIPSQRECTLDKWGNVVFWELAYYYRWTEIVFSVAVMVACFILYTIMFEFVRRARCKIERHKSRTWSVASSSAAERELIANGASDFRDRAASSSGSTVAVLSLRQEFPILVQSFLITSSLALLLFSSYAYTVLEDEFLPFSLNQCAGLLNSAMPPLLYVCFSTAVRNLVFSHARQNWTRHSSSVRLTFARFGIGGANESPKPACMNRKISRSCPALQARGSSCVLIKESCSVAVAVEM